MTNPAAQRGPKPKAPTETPNPRKAEAIDRAYEWAVHANSQFSAPLQGETDLDRKASHALHMLTMERSRDMATMWAAVAAQQPTHLPAPAQEQQEQP